MIVGQPDPTKPGFPPLLRGEALRANLDPVTKAVSMAMRGIDPGLVVWSEDTTAARAALVLTPEEPLETAIGILFAAELGLADSLGALAPPEVAVHFIWPDRIKVNGALCGRMKVVASNNEPTSEPDWLVIGMEIPIMPIREAEPGDTPDQTALSEEGCGDITAPQLIENWARHTMVWISRFVDDGIAPLHTAWREKCDTVGEDVETPQKGTFMGLDENGGMLLKNNDGTTIIPLTSMLEVKS